MKGLDFLADTKGVVILAGVAIAAYLGYRLMKAAPSISPANAKNADGTPQTAYVGAGPVGVVAAATNAASGGWLSTFGDWLGSKAADATQDDPNADANAALAAANASNQLTGANAALTGDNDAATALYNNPIDYGAGAGW
jgi:hypothetical protein